MHPVTQRISIVGYGAVGRLFGDLFRADGFDVICFDRHRSPGVHIADACHPSDELLNAISRSDILLLALPEEALLTALDRLGEHAPSPTLLVETASVKTVLEPLKKSRLAQREILGLNPMFAPSLGIRGQTVVVSKQHPAAATARFEQWLQSKEAILVYMEAERHDQLMANAQALVHASILGFADALRRSGVAIEDFLAVAPPPFRVMTALAARILSQAPETYWDIQASNPYAREARLHLRQGLDRCEEESIRVDAQSFAKWLSELDSYYAKQKMPLQEVCANLFSGLPSRTGSSRPSYRVE